MSRSISKCITTLILALTFSSALLAQAADVNIQWLGGPSMLIEFNGMQILTDPMLGEGDHAFEMADPNEMFDLKKGPTIRFHRRLTALPDINLGSLDLVLLSHAHEDHFDQKAQSTLAKSLPFILPIDDVNKVQKAGFTMLNALQAGQTKTYSAGQGQIQITAIPADHTDNKALEPLLGHGLGYLIKFIEGKQEFTLYWTGDTLATPGVINTVKALGAIDLLVPNMGRVGTTGPLGKISMGASDLITLANTLKVKKVFPIHHTSYELYLEPISELSRLASNQTWGLDILSEGSGLSYSTSQKKSAFIRSDAP
ncbi:MAG: N-acyl-phosphatidylethanolamine-hydrolyzing phospholipase D [Oleispira sp.]|jgi:N-acyl-phosphatidylethanolamine-hydrolysing phospholipase D